MSGHPQRASDRAMHLRHLRQADEHVAQGKRNIAAQEDRVAELTKRGCNTKIAQGLLDTFYGLQAEHILHRDRILKELVQ